MPSKNMDYLIIPLKNPDQSVLQDILNIYIQEGWWDGGYDLKNVLEIIKGSHIFYAALDNNAVIGMGRAISDGVSDAYIQDVAVKKEYRKQNIGSSIIKEIVKKLKQEKILWIGLISEKNSHEFYKKLNFEEMKNTYPMKYKIKTNDI